MKKKAKAIRGYGLILAICILAIFAVLALSQKTLQNFQEQASQTSAAYLEQIEELEEKVADLEKDNKTLQELINQNIDFGSGLITSQQAMSDLKDIYELYKDGKKDQAKSAFERINTMGFDDNALSYYEILSDILNK